MAFNLMHYAAEGDLKKLKKMIDFGVYIDASNVRKETPLFLCSLNGHIKCTEYLLTRGANPNRTSLVGMTPLHAAIQQNHIKCVGLLLQYGSDLHSTFAEYPTVVAFARYHGNPEIMRLLHAFMVDRGLGHHQPAQNYNAIVMNSCASASCIKVAEDNMDGSMFGIPIINLDDIKKPEHKQSFNGPFFAYVDGMWGGSLVTVKYAQDFSQDEFFHFRLRKEINLLRQLRHFRFPVVMAVCLDPFCLIMERFYHTTLSFYLRDPNMDMEKDLECHLTRIMRIMLDVAQALSHLHRKNWIHCHVSSQSILAYCNPHHLHLCLQHFPTLTSSSCIIAVLVCDGPRAKLGSLEFCERPGAAVEFMECFQEEMPWLAPELLAVGEARFPADIYSLAATFWECLTRTVPWSWLPEKQIPVHHQLPILLCWPSLIKHLMSQCLDEADKRPTVDDLCRKLGEFMRLGIWLDRYQLDDMFKRWLDEHGRKPSEILSRRTSASYRSDIVAIALGEKYSPLVQGSQTSMELKEQRAYYQTRRRSVLAETGKPLFRRRSAIVTTLVEEAFTTIAQVGRPILDVREADIYKFGFKLAREIAELRGICKMAMKRQRKAWAKVAMVTRDLEEDMFDSLVGYEEVTFRRKHAHAANLKKHHQEKEEEKLKESLDRKKSLIKKHKRKNWACYTILLFDLYGILRRRDTIVDDSEEDFEKELLNQSIARISSQMRRLSNILVDTVDGTIDDKVSGTFSLFPIDVAQLARRSDGSIQEVITSVYNHDTHGNVCHPTPSDDEPTDPENIPPYPEDTPSEDHVENTDPKNEPESAEVKQSNAEGGTTSDDYTATGADESLGADESAQNNDYIPASPDGSMTFLDDPAAETSTPRIKSKTSKIKSIFKRRKTKKQGRKGKYMESSV